MWLPTVTLSLHLFFSCLLFALFTFQELSEVFPVCLYPASVLIFLFLLLSFFTFFFLPPPGQPQLNLVAAEQQSLLTCSIPGELIQSLSVCGSLQRAPAQSCSKLAACSAFKCIMERAECQGRRAGRVGSRGLDSSGKWCRRGEEGPEKYPGKIHRYTIGRDPRWEWNLRGIEIL